MDKENLNYLRRMIQKKNGTKSTDDGIQIVNQGKKPICQHHSRQKYRNSLALKQTPKIRNGTIRTIRIIKLT